MSDSHPDSLVLEVSGLEVAYGPHAVLEDINLCVTKGELVAISGPNGGGKTTFLRACLGLVKPRAGKIRVLGMEAGDPRGLVRIGYVPQRPKIAYDFPGTVREVVLSGAWPKAGLWRKLSKYLHESVHATIEACGLAEVERRRVGELSGGMQQRVFLARALASHPDLLFLDEPIAGIDLPSQMEFRRLLTDLLGSGEMTVVVVVHEYGPFEGLVDRLVILAEKVLYDGAPPQHEGTDHKHHTLPTEYLSLFKEIRSAET